MITDIVAGTGVWPALLRIVALLILTSCVTRSASARGPHGSATADRAMVLGTWAGRSTCVGNRPACKNEEVVYRFVEVDSQPGLVTLLADKIIDGRRVPMYKLEFHCVEADHSLTCEFRRGQTHGVWAYTVSGDTMTGTLVILPDKTLGRRVSVHRVREDRVPKAPALDEYSAMKRSLVGASERRRSSCTGVTRGLRGGTAMILSSANLKRLAPFSYYNLSY